MQVDLKQRGYAKRRRPDKVKQLVPVPPVLCRYGRQVRLMAQSEHPRRDPHGGNVRLVAHHLTHAAQALALLGGLEAAVLHNNVRNEALAAAVAALRDPHGTPLQALNSADMDLELAEGAGDKEEVGRGPRGSRVGCPHVGLPSCVDFAQPHVRHGLPGSAGEVWWRHQQPGVRASGLVGPGLPLAGVTPSLQLPVGENVCHPRKPGLHNVLAPGDNVHVLRARQEGCAGALDRKGAHPNDDHGFAVEVQRLGQVTDPVDNRPEKVLLPGQRQVSRSLQGACAEDDGACPHPLHGCIGPVSAIEARRPAVEDLHAKSVLHIDHPHYLPATVDAVRHTCCGRSLSHLRQDIVPLRVVLLRRGVPQAVGRLMVLHSAGSIRAAAPYASKAGLPLQNRDFQTLLGQPPGGG
mmetsp:Transcript_27227/g.85023  ORF Transcript_27227/g.85023 Transcript_27227/m.85023 type:complete len:408 (-) Transcript_27227:108-1331(-)